MRFFATALVFCGVASFSQSPQVPHKLHFAGMTLNVHADARSEIQKDVDALTASPKYFNIKVERAKTYFPIIEKIFKEENVPDELKYLVIQESALISDAVSTSNAVGYWQFKAETAKEMGLKVDKRVDERMNIAAASRGAAKYFKQSNSYFNNWLLVVQSYQMGIGGTMRSVDQDLFGERHMNITKDTYWYVKKYLAHKVAFEHAMGGKGQVEVTPVLASGISLDEISKKSGVEVDKLKDYNKWIKDGSVPDDKDYTVVIPKGDLTDFNTLWLSSSKKTATTSTASAGSLKETEVNGLRAVVAPSGETVTSLARKMNVDLSDFISWNEVSVDARVAPGQVYYLQRKIKTSTQSTHTTKSGESLWAISQNYGVRLKSLKRLNGNLSEDMLKPGTVVYLADLKENYKTAKAALLELDHNSPFEWGISGKSELDYVIPSGEVLSSATVKDTSKPETKAILTPAESHTVSAGETFYSISAKYGLSIPELQRINNLDADTRLQPGQILKLVEVEPVEPSTAHHEVKPTDTIYSIARQYGLSVKELLELNSKRDFEIKPGQKLIIR
jgi:membrane-bound lytic murein transglycosylase D